MYYKAFFIDSRLTQGIAPPRRFRRRIKPSTIRGVVTRKSRSGDIVSHKLPTPCDRCMSVYGSCGLLRTGFARPPWRAQYASSLFDFSKVTQ
jgi:hypothetical protein